MRTILALLALVTISACATDGAPDTRAQQARGRALAETHCSSCHAVGRRGESPAPEAPPFRHLSRNYRVDTLQEALAEGISVGHPAMPQFQFHPEDADAVVVYLESIQDRSRPE